MRYALTIFFVVFFFFALVYLQKLRSANVLEWWPVARICRSRRKKIFNFGMKIKKIMENFYKGSDYTFLFVSIENSHFCIIRNLYYGLKIVLIANYVKMLHFGNISICNGV